MKNKLDVTLIDSISVISKPGKAPVLAQSKDFHFGYYETIGKRPSQEDALAWKLINPATLANLSPLDIAYRLWTTYRLLDEKMPSNLGESGSTASTTVYDGRGNLITASLADAASFAAVYSTNGRILGVIRLNSVTHKPTDPSEEARIQAAGGNVLIGRVQGILAVSRAIGDNYLKKAGVCSEANIDITNIDALSDALKIDKNQIGTIQVITTCDGFTDGAGPNRQTIEAHEKYLQGLLTNKPEKCTEAELSKYLAESAIKDGSRDNVSVSVQTLPINNDFAVFQGVYDGHGGNGTAHYVADNITRIFSEQCALTQQEYKAQALSVDKNQAVFTRDNSKLVPAGLAPAPVVAVEQPANDIDVPEAPSSSQPQVNAKREAELEQLRIQLNIFLEKMRELESKRKDDKYNVAAEAASRVYNSLVTHQEAYVNNEISKQLMMDRVNTVLNEGSPDVQILNSHRGWKQVLVDIATAFAGLFVIYGIAAAIKGSVTLFPVATATGNKINDLKKAFDDINQLQFSG